MSKPNGTSCSLCCESFSLFRNRYSCKICSRTFCDNCAPRRLELNNDRSCDNCFIKHHEFLITKAHKCQFPIRKFVSDDIYYCMNCQTGFSILTRRKSCKRCGNIVCAACSPRKVVLPEIGPELVRVCDDCYSLVCSARAHCMIIKFSI